MMKFPLRKMTPENMASITKSNLYKIQNFIKLSNSISNETKAKKKERLEKYLCKACFYFTGIGGAAMTTQPCMSCGGEELYGSTNTDVLCLKCAKENHLCKHCGGDIEMNIKRKTWFVV